MAAVLACGEGAALSHRSAAALLGIGSELSGRIDVTVPRRCELRRAGLLIRGRPTLAAGDLGFSDGIPVTSPTRTLIDLTTELDIVAIERAVNDADKRDLIDPESLRVALDQYTGEPGVRPLRMLLDKLTFRLSDSDLEIGVNPRTIAQIAAKYCQSAGPFDRIAAQRSGGLGQGCFSPRPWDGRRAACGSNPPPIP